MNNRQIALITGANKGIGFATARELGARGLTVFLGSRDAGRGQEAASTLAAEKMDVRFVALDVTSQESIEVAYAQVKREAGRLDILINNAGISVDSAARSLCRDCDESTRPTCSARSRSQAHSCRCLSKDVRRSLQISPVA